MLKLARTHRWTVLVGTPIVALVAAACGGQSGAPNSGQGGGVGTTGGATGFSGGPSFGGSLSTGGVPGTSGGAGNTTGGVPGTSGGAGNTTGGVPGTSGGATSTTGGTTGTTGGTTGTTGGTVATGGTGGMGPKMKLCAAPVTPAQALLTDFETYDGKVEPSKYGFTWATMAYGGFFPIPDESVTPTMAILAGHAGNYGMNVSILQAAKWGGAIGMWLSPTCIDASTFKGITFWVRGKTPTGTFNLGLSMEQTSLPDATDPAGGGTCTGTKETCKDAAVNDIPLTADWTQVSLPWSMFIPGVAAGTMVPVTGAKLTGMTFTLPLKWIQDPASPVDMPTYIPEKGDIDFSFDDLGFIP